MGWLLNATGAYLRAHPRYPRARLLLQRALSICPAICGPAHPNTASALDNFAASLSARGRHTDGLPLQQRALAITEAARGPDHPDTVLTNLAATLDAPGQHGDVVAVRERPTAPVDDGGPGASGP